MPGSPWALAALVLVPAAQVPAVLYLSRYVELDDDEDLPARPTRPGTAPDASDPPEPGPATDHGTGVGAGTEPGATPGPDPASEPATAVASDRVACPACGARNEAGYHYCRACVAPLGGAPA